MYSSPRTSPIKSMMKILLLFGLAASSALVPSARKNLEPPSVEDHGAAVRLFIADDRAGAAGQSDVESGDGERGGHALVDHVGQSHFQKLLRAPAEQAERRDGAGLADDRQLLQPPFLVRVAEEQRAE